MVLTISYKIASGRSDLRRRSQLSAKIELHFIFLHLFVDIISKVRGTFYKAIFCLIGAPHTIPTPTRVFHKEYESFSPCCFHVAQSPAVPDSTGFQQS